MGNYKVSNKKSRFFYLFVILGNFFPKLLYDYCINFSEGYEKKKRFEAK